MPSEQMAELMKHKAVVTRTEHHGPLKWWASQCVDMYEACVLAMFVFARPITSARTERLFSRCRWLKGVYRTSLSTRSMYLQALAQMHPDIADRVFLSEDMRQLVEHWRAFYKQRDEEARALAKSLHSTSSALPYLGPSPTFQVPEGWTETAPQ
jgi:hypothetical protein